MPYDVPGLDVFAVDDGWRFRLPSGYESHTVFETKKECEECSWKAFWRHQAFPPDYKLV